MVTARNIANLLSTAQFGGTGASPPAARSPAAAYIPSFKPAGAPAAPAGPIPTASPAAPAQVGAPTPPAGVAALLQDIMRNAGVAPARAPAPPAPPPPMPALSAEANMKLAAALESEEAKTKPLWIAPEDLGDMGTALDADTLPALLESMGLHTLPLAGGVLIARSPAIIEAAERSRDEGMPVPIILVNQAPGPKARQRPRD
jgi:hypothetical protein